MIKCDRVFIVRHAESTYNAASWRKNYDPNYDVALADARITEHGISQCLEAGQTCIPKLPYLKVIIVSPLRRSLSTVY